VSEVDLEQVAARVAGWARDGEQVEAYVARLRDTNVRVFDGDVESLSSAQTEGVGVRVVAGRRQGFAYAGALAEESLRDALTDARDNAGFGGVDEFLGLPEPDGVAPAELDLFRAALEGCPADRKVDLALELDRAVRAADARIRGVETAEYGDASSEMAVASSTGVSAHSRHTTCALYAFAIAGESADTQTGYGWSIGRAPDDLDVHAAATMAADRATRLLGARKPASRRVTAVLDPMVTAAFLGVLSGALSGESVLKGRSMFAGREGESVAVPDVTLVDDPTNSEARGAGRYDAEGLATRRNVLIDAGALRGFVHNAYTGRRSGTASTGSAVRGGFKTTPGTGTRALSLEPGDRTQAELLTEIGEGLLVLSVQGLHSGANPVSGDFSVGCEGLVVRDGAPAEPVREATIASTLQRMLLDVVGVGSDLEWLPGGAAGVSLAIRDVTLSGA
jgi:PmbA protein